MACERRNTTQPTDWWDAWTQQAKKEGISLADWIGRQCTKALPKDVRQGLSKRAGRGERKPVG